MSSLTSSVGGSQQPLLEFLGLDQQFELTPYAIRYINAGDDVPSALLQRLSFERMAGDEIENERYKIVLSDGKYMQLAILPPKYVELLHTESLKIGFELLLMNYACRYVWNTR
ncbi:hypothetical protein SUGI_0120810 [Cryptomeria japonica]|nr:hypothetical protein SUGI_0120810 [Cryptomeria japonica]